MTPPEAMRALGQTLRNLARGEYKTLSKRQRQSYRYFRENGNVPILEAIDAARWPLTLVHPKNTLLI